jgi:glutathione peroxidase
MTGFLLTLIMMTMSGETPGIYAISAKSITGETIEFSQYKGQKLLIVNTASKCGFTPQYEELQQLHEAYGDKITVLGFPSNNFLGQEPGTNEEIQQFCQKNYGVTFQMFSKIDVKGKNKHPLYEWLSNKELNGWNGKSPSWNFCKYLVDEEGHLVSFFGSSVKPTDEKILSFIREGKN